MEDGRALDYEDDVLTNEPVALETYGESPVYVADAQCTYVVTEGP